MESLWGEEFEIPTKQEVKEKVKKIKDKIANPREIKTTVTKTIKSKSVSLESKLETITQEVLRVLGKQKDNTICIRDIQTLHQYIDRCIENGRIDIDTETNNSLDPITCKLMGPCIYTPGEKNVYIPINHRNPQTKELLPDQLTEKDIYEEFNRLIDAKTFIVMHNGKFDYQVLKCTTGFISPIHWDTMIAAKLLDENEYSAGLKQQYISKIDPDQEKYSIDHLFEGVEYADVDPEIFALYAATDAMMTDKLYQYQLPLLTSKDNEKVYKLFQEVEMPLVPVLAEMELNGMEVDLSYGERLSKKNHELLDDIDVKLNDLLTKLKPVIAQWKLSPDALDAQKKKQSEKQRANALKSANYDDTLWSNVGGVWYKVSKSRIEQIDEELTPNSLASPTQLAIVLYHILGCPCVNQEKPEATGEEELTAISKKHISPEVDELCSLMLKRRELVKLLSTYIDNIPELAKRWPDGRVRTHFNQYGAQTGRLSSSDPINFQNIPSHNKAIRLLFRAHEGHRIVGGDFSAQEPRIVAHFSNDENMRNAYLEGRDLYSVIASQSFNKPYEDCLEFYPEGTVIEFEGNKVTCGYKTHQNKEGKGRRTQAKSILLGILYGRGPASIAEQIGKTKEEAEDILNKFFNAFPTVKTWIEDSQNGCRKNGWVEDVAGRKRRLPDIQLPKFTVRYKDPNMASGDFNPFLGCTNRTDGDSLLQEYRKKAESCKSKKQSDDLKIKASYDGIEIINNGGFISQAERQCVNARVQGSAATLTKCALIAIYNDPRMKEIGAKLINTVHDEILLEVPVENSERCEELLTENMVTSAKAWVPLIPMKCDTYNVDAWYMDEYQVLLESEYKHLVEDGMADTDAENKVIANHTELFARQVSEAIHTGELHI